MDENELAISFAECFDKSSTSIAGELTEVALDSFLQDGFLKDFPVISTATSIYHAGKSIGEYAYMKKLVAFLNAINSETVDEQKRSDYSNKIRTNAKFCNSELEHILILLDRYIGTQKPEMLAKLYLAYLDGTILWEEFSMYAEVIDRFLPGDYRILQSNPKITCIRNTGSEPLLRLMAQGLVAEETNSQLFEEENGRISVTTSSMSRMMLHEKVFQRTEFGEQLVSILGQM